jgi:predicted translin family RNA/ssDNA-binding protein
VHVTYLNIKTFWLSRYVQDYLFQKEVSELKQQLHEKEDQHNKLLQQSPTRRDVMSPPSHFVVHHHHEDSPVTDLITAQIEINQLSKQTERLQAQVKHWKSVAQAKQVCW